MLCLQQLGLVLNERTPTTTGSMYQDSRAGIYFRSFGFYLYGRPTVSLEVCVCVCPYTAYSLQDTFSGFKRVVDICSTSKVDLSENKIFVLFQI